MKYIFAFVILTLSTGCALFSPYRLAGWEILELTPDDNEFDPAYPKRNAYFCWVSSNVNDGASESAGCNYSMAPETSLSKCIQELHRNTLTPADKATVRQQIVVCMQSKGWRRQLIVIMT